MSEEGDRIEAMMSAFDDVLAEGEGSPAGFEITRELDRGGMAVVYLAEQLEPEREVALKVVLPQFAGVDEIARRFQREGRAMAALEHAGILPVYQVGNWDGMPFLAMKLAKGGSLSERLKVGLPEVSQAVNWMVQIAEAVHFAHQRGVLHRDLKPGNLLFDEEGSIYVGDFGVAKLEFARDGGLTQTEAIVGTPNYLAPEVAAGTSSVGSVSADLYGLGAVFYECLTGRRPHDDAPNLAAQLRSVVDDELVPVRKRQPDVPRDVAVICEKALAKNPSDRYASVAAFGEDLQRWQEGRAIIARSEIISEKLWRWTKRHPFSAALSLTLITVVVAAALLLTQNYQRQSELVQELLLEGAKDERLLKEPGYRERAFTLLAQAKAKGDPERVREEAVAILTSWDASDRLREWKPRPDGAGRLEVLKDGVKVLGDEEWFLPGGTPRCDPALSEDGRFLAMVRGDRMEVVIYDVPRTREFSRITLDDWPETVSFDESGERLRVRFENGEGLFVNVRGEVLLKEFARDAVLLPPVGFRTWTGQVFSPSETNPYGARLSPNEKLLVTVSVSGVQTWSVAEGTSRDFHETENQRIDAPTEVWWLSDRELLLQVPGSLEVLQVNEKGEFSSVQQLQREPGSRVVEVSKGGDWTVEVRDEDGVKSLEVWPAGDVKRAEEFGRPEAVARESVEQKTNRVSWGKWNFLLPQRQKAKAVFVLEEAGKVVVLTENYAIYDWDLGTLEEELAKRGF